jgi:putative tryptophan/tyrosine transport system substrate-binding protein
MRLVGLVVILGFSLTLAPLVSEAEQPGNMWQFPPFLDGLREGLTALDWRNLPDEEAERSTAQALVSDRVDLIVAFENQTVRAVTAATAEIPVVMLHVTTPVENRFIKSFARPGGNVTGFAGLGDSPAKEVELSKELVPRLKLLLVLFDASEPSTRWLAAARQAATNLKLGLVEGQTAQRADIEQGALSSYNLDLRSVGTAAARYVDKILKGTKPADLPVEQSAQLQPVNNLKTANAGLTIPPSVLL